MGFWKKVFCPHLIWIRTEGQSTKALVKFMISGKIEYTCADCGKEVFREPWNAPVNYVEKT